MSPANEKKLPQAAAPAGANTPAFQSYSEALKRAHKENNASDQAGDDSTDGHNHNLELVKEDGVVKKIKLTCKCGEVIEIDCDYGEK